MPLPTVNKLVPFVRHTLPAWIKSRVEISTLVAALIVAASVWAFVSVGGEVLEGDAKGLDTEILLSLRSATDPSDPLGPMWFEELGRDMTALGGNGVLTMLTCFVALYLWLSGKRRSMWLVLAAIVSGFMMSQALKWGFSRPRPDLVPHGTYVYTASFPSGHAMMSAVTYLTLAILVARVQERWSLRALLIGAAVFLTMLIGISRVYLGVHWPSDVLAGWTAGAAWAVAWWMVARWLERRGAVDPQAGESVPEAPPAER
ncbi:phosphatase PAP2 family protein [Aurantimonas sp. HBX-1]|uniref:phosphatase PAP2 family protein n=1 Tax=Aurantimonas sp. HBX-1 TaxID=2906072 RepID=UPI001F47F18C|nr:phosphatase PAP2 family protein [Aurantimonas sp. HBX-1]UIJ73114.1 phosphatase PAP2 family protein [Aurantimonas sp. HBX-1]